MTAFLDGVYLTNYQYPSLPIFFSLQKVLFFISTTYLYKGCVSYCHSQQLLQLLDLLREEHQHRYYIQISETTGHGQVSGNSNTRGNYQIQFHVSGVFRLVVRSQLLYPIGYTCHAPFFISKMTVSKSIKQKVL